MSCTILGPPTCKELAKDFSLERGVHVRVVNVRVNIYEYVAADLESAAVSFT